MNNQLSVTNLQKSFAGEPAVRASDEAVEDVAARLSAAQSTLAERMRGWRWNH